MIETIAAAIGTVEETLTASDASSILKESGASDAVISTALTATGNLFTSAGKHGCNLIVASVPDIDLGNDMKAAVTVCYNRLHLYKHDKWH